MLWTRLYRHTPRCAALVQGTTMAAILSLCLLQPIGVAAHDDPEGRIAALNDQIELTPGDPELFLARGRLLRLDGHRADALSDFEHASELDPTLDEPIYLRGATLLELGRAAEAKPLLDRYIARHPGDEGARAARARSLAALGEGLAANDDFNRAIAVNPNPDYYLEQARALALAGHHQAAVAGLDQGLKRLGSLVSLQRLALDLELAQGNLEAALGRIDQLATATRRADLWLARRGDVLQEAGRNDEARDAYSQALAAIEQLSARRRGNRTVADLEVRLRAALSQPGGG